MSDPCCEFIGCTFAALSCCFSCAGSCGPLNACWCCKRHEEDDPTVYGSDREFKPGENESRFSGYRFWRWKTRKEDDEFADQVMKEEAGLQREPLTAKRSSDSSGSGREGHGRSSSVDRAVVATQPPPSKSMEDGRRSVSGATSGEA